MMGSNIQIRPGRIIHIAVHENPHSDTTVFLIHGLGGRGNQWREQIDMLKQHYTLVIPDLLGHGQSEKPKTDSANPYSFSELDQDIHAIFNHYSSNKNIIIGHSYGGALATSLSLDHQDNITQLILLSPTPCVPNIPIPFFYHLPIFMMEAIRPLLDRQFLRLAFTKNANPALIAIESRANQANPMYVIKQIVNGMQNMPAIDLTMLNTPTLVIVSKPDNLISPDAQQQFYKKLPNHTFDIIPNASHMALLEKPEMVNSSIMKFLGLTIK
jgi:pimeloyl-ACP methyl ester carboxylesterase